VTADTPNETVTITYTQDGGGQQGSNPILNQVRSQKILMTRSQLMIRNLKIRLLKRRMIPIRR